MFPYFAKKLTNLTNQTNLIKIIIFEFNLKHWKILYHAVSGRYNALKQLFFDFSIIKFQKI